MKLPPTLLTVLVFFMFEIRIKSSEEIPHVSEWDNENSLSRDFSVLMSGFGKMLKKEPKKVWKK